MKIKHYCVIKGFYEVDSIGELKEIYENIGSSEYMETHYITFSHWPDLGRYASLFQVYTRKSRWENSVIPEIIVCLDMDFMSEYVVIDGEMSLVDFKLRYLPLIQHFEREHEIFLKSK